MTGSTTRPVRPRHTGMVGLPLFLTMIFCFAFVMVQAHQADNAQSAAGTSDNIQDKASLGINHQPKSKLSPSSSSHDKSSLKTSSPDDSAASPVNPASGSAGSETTTPQPGDAAKTLQTALPNDQPGNAILPKITQLNKAVEGAGKELDHLVHQD